MRLLGPWFVALAMLALAEDWGPELDEVQSKLDSALQWGTYRPNLYFGTRPRVPHSLLSGLMWFGLDDQQNWRSIRHSCELSDNLDEYGYIRHNGRDFGEQVMLDAEHGVEIRSEFIKVPGEHGGSWAVRFTGRTLENNLQGVSLAYYFGLEGNGNMSMEADSAMVTIDGSTPDLGEFKARIIPGADNQGPLLPRELEKIKDIPNIGKVQAIALEAPRSSIWQAKDIFQKMLFKQAQAKAKDILQRTNGKGPLTGGVLFGINGEKSSSDHDNNLIFGQMIVHGEFSFDVIYECSDKSATIDSNDIGTIARSRREEFDNRFETIFALQEKGFNDDEVEMAQKALSSLIGGMGYFYGSSLVSADPKPEYSEDENTAEPELSEPYSLFAIAPSRPFFPRGFLWDEGFHLLLLGQWDPDLSMDVIRSWYGTMDSRGWIAREQILGDEARSKVPKEFQVQYPNFANPPTLLFAIKALAERLETSDSTNMLDQLAQVYCPHGQCDSKTEKTLTPKHIEKLSHYLSKQLQFFTNTQAGLAGRGYRWRGRTMEHTLTSGLDDYPRARPPSTSELHVDLFSWVTFMFAVDVELAAQTGDGERALSSERQLDKHMKQLDELHWNTEKDMYCDVTTRKRDDFDELEDNEADSEESVFVCHKGYVSLLPMVLGLIDPGSAKLGYILDMIEDPDELWSDYGIRSLSKSDPYYGKGENYWRGPIWLNFNYLVLSSLHKNYISVDSPHQAQAKRIYNKLRSNLISNVLAQCKETRFFWEQYNPEDGHGQGTHPFTGWTTLIVLIMAERY
ncbi:glycoside hydrolase [Coemansia reversa NRRL 1564]|uniref:Mannosyl-oligosaccharide glucosidase n=1 Tax=Coemansia reversa (strain ATCC 12441 / NRRL 1564) TaxID=763665 RepID=A0A2G5BKZ7_COERN|nr:glycoside hydrolase [Coemansia reversa NRRL 1564]|eukprot:PIA19689.1 glycoside hydrolase [Coemansia reversa NRRL 1564]